MLDHNYSVKIGRKRGACSHCSGNGHVCDGSKASKVVGGSSSSRSSSSSQCCDKCGKIEHSTEDCLYFKGDREQHPDATTRHNGYYSDVSAQPDIVGTLNDKDKDGHCLFRSLGNFNFGVSGLWRCLQLRRELAEYQLRNPTMQVYGTTTCTYEEYVRQEKKNQRLDEYVLSMKDSSKYGGAFEMDAFSKMKRKRVIVYVKKGGVWTCWLVIGKDYGPENDVRLGFVNNNHYGSLLLNVNATQKLRATEAKAAEEGTKRKEKAAQKAKKDAEDKKKQEEKAAQKAKNAAINKKAAEAAAAVEAAKASNAAKVLADIEVQKQAEQATIVEAASKVRAAVEAAKAANAAKVLAEQARIVEAASKVRATFEAAKAATAAKVLADIEKEIEDKRKAETATKILADEIPQGIRAAADYEKACDLFKKLSPGTAHLCKVSSVHVSSAQNIAAVYSWCSVYCLLWCVRFAVIWVLLWLLATM